MQEVKGLEKKILECKELVIQNLEKSCIQKNMVWVFLKENKVSDDVDSLSLNPKQGVVKLRFKNHEKAKEFYDDYNFNRSILMRPFNLYFNLTLADDEVKKYFLEGLTDDSQRKLFDAARKVGICKLSTSYSLPNKGPIKPKGLLSFVRSHELSETEFKQLEKELAAMGIKISTYISDKSFKCSIILNNFYPGKTDRTDDEIAKDAEQIIKERFGKVIKNPFDSVSVNVKRKETSSGEEVNVPAIIEFAENEQTLENYELIRKAILNDEKARVTLNFHRDESDSYISLFTSGLKMPEAWEEELDRAPAKKVLYEKKFEDKLLGDFQKVNKNVVQVNIYPVRKGNDVTYVGRVYLRQEQEGKNFIVDYVTKRDVILNNYKDKNMINFNINVDSRTLQKIKNNEKKASNIMKQIKMADENVKRQKRQVPLGKMPGMNFIPGNVMQQQTMPMGGPMPMPNMGAPMFNQPNMGGSNIPSPGMGNIQGPGGMGGMIPSMGGMKGPDYKAMAAKFVKDREVLMKEPPQVTKKMLYPCLKNFLEEQGVSNSESGIKIERLLNKVDVGEALNLLEDPSKLRSRVDSLN